MKFSSSWRGIRVIRVRVNRVNSMQGKLDLVRVSGEFELSEFELSGFYCSCEHQRQVKIMLLRS